MTQAQNEPKKSPTTKIAIGLIIAAIVVITCNVFLVNLMNDTSNKLKTQNECITQALQLEDSKTTLMTLTTNAITIYGQLEDGDDKTNLETKIDEVSDLIDYSTSDVLDESTSIDYASYKTKYKDKTQEIEDKTDELNTLCNELINKYNLAMSE